MITWTKMAPVHFDTALAPSKAKARKIVAVMNSADGSLFPDLLPKPERTAAATRELLPGEVPMFDLGPS